MILIFRVEKFFPIEKTYRIGIKQTNVRPISFEGYTSYINVDVMGILDLHDSHIEATLSMHQAIWVT
jgi:hypothetical protein